MKNRLLKKCLPILLFMAISTVAYVPVTVQASRDFISISLTESRYEPIDTTPPSLDIRFEPSGTHIDSKGNLKVRLDFYPNPEDKSYEMQHVFVVDEKSDEFKAGYKGEVDKDGNPLDEKDYQTWIDSLPHVWQTNPALCHFLTVKPDITKEELDVYVKQLFPSSVTATIDDAMSQANSAHLISPYMRDKSSTTSIKISKEFTNETLLCETVNSRLSGYQIGGQSGGKVEDVKPQSIDVGSAATNRESFSGSGWTSLALDNPANADGSLDTVEIWLKGAGEITGGTLYGSSTSYTSRDSENLGYLAAGSKQTVTSLSISVLSGDFIGAYSLYGDLEADSSGYSGNYQKAGDQFGAGTQTYTLRSGDTLSLYATGTEPPSFAISNSPPDTKDFGIVASGATLYAKGSAPANPVVDANCTYTLTNSGSQCDIDAEITDFTGGTTTNIVSGSPGANEARVTLYFTGQNPASTVLANTPTEVLDAFAPGTKMWDFKLELGTIPNEPNQHTGTITLTAVAED